MGLERIFSKASVYIRKRLLFIYCDINDVCSSNYLKNLDGEGGGMILFERAMKSRRRISFTSIF